MKIAVCDDNPVQLDHMVYRLEEYFSVRSEPVRIDEYSDGKELLEKLTKYKYDVIILGFAMKELNGIQTAVEIKEIDDEAMIIFNTIMKNIDTEEYKIDEYCVLNKNMSRVECLNNIDKIYHEYKKKSSDNDRPHSRILFTERHNLIKQDGFTTHTQDI